MPSLISTRARLLVHVGRSWALLEARRPGGDAPLRAAGALTRAVSDARAAGDARLESYALGWLGELYERGGRADDALGLTQRALGAGLRADAPDALYRWQWQAGRLHRAAGRSDEALAAYRSAAATHGQLREQTAASGADFVAAFGGAGELNAELVDLLLGRVAQFPDAAEHEALLRETLATLESQRSTSCATTSGTIASRRSAAPRPTRSPVRSSSTRWCSRTGSS